MSYLRLVQHLMERRKQLALHNSSRDATHQLERERFLNASKTASGEVDYVLADFPQLKSRRDELIAKRHAERQDAERRWADVQSEEP